MKFGVCTVAENILIAQYAGCDYIEMGFGDTASITDEEFLARKAYVDSARIKVEAMNGFIPGSFSLLSDCPDERSRVLALVERGMRRAQILGTEVVVFGSGAARRVPDGMSWETAFGRLAVFLQQAQEIAEKYSIRIAVEPLNRMECNIINSVNEGYVLALASGMDSAGGLADLYHMAMENENMDGILKADKRLLHCHIANPKGRRYPLSREEYDYAAFFDALRKIDYQGRVSIEAGTDDIEEELGRAISVLRTF